MKITIVTLFPKMIEGFLNESIIKRAQEKKVVKIELVNLRAFAVDEYGTVDDRPYGGGAGMIMRIDVIHRALSQISNSKFQTSNHTQNHKYKTILTSPKGKTLNQEIVKEFSKLNHLVILAGHYEGVDERISEYIDEEISLGDFILTGGELVAATIADAVTRLLPGVLKKEGAADNESFITIPIDQLINAVGNNPRLEQLIKKGIKKVKLLEYPHYTRPETYNNQTVPPILLSGDHQEIENWRLVKAFEETEKKRPDLLQ